MKITFLILVFMCAALIAVEQRTVPWQGKLFKNPADGGIYLSISNEHLYVDFKTQDAWTIQNIRHKDQTVGSPSGGTGAVVQWQWNDPTLIETSIASWPSLCKQLYEGGQTNTLSLPRRLWNDLPEALHAQVAHFAQDPKSTSTDLDKPAMLSLLNKKIQDAAMFDEAFLAALSKHPQCVYASRFFNQIKGMREKGVDGTNQELCRLNRKLLEYALPGSIKPLSDSIGTGHGGEVIRNLTMKAGEQTVPLIQDGKGLFKMGDTYSGQTVTILKESVMGPFDHVATFEFPEHTEGYLATHQFTANADMERGSFDGYMYDFMHMMPPSFCDFLVIFADGKEWEGKAERKIDTQSHLIIENWKTLIGYSEELKTGVVYNYPEAYQGKNHVLVRFGKDKKFRAMHLKREGWKVGETLILKLKLTPFTAEPGEWKEKGRLIAHTDKF